MNIAFIKISTFLFCICIGCCCGRFSVNYMHASIALHCNKMKK